MRRATIVGGAIAAVLALIAFVLAVDPTAHGPDEDPAASIPSRGAPAVGRQPATTPASAASARGFLYGRVIGVDGTTLEGRLRFGQDEEAFWDDSFNGTKRKNPWIADISPERLPTERRSIEIFGFEIARRERPADLDRPLMVPFGTIAAVEARGRDVHVTLKGGSVVVVDRLDASDFDDGVRVWDAGRGVVDLDSRRIRRIEFLPTPAFAGAPSRLHGTVRTRRGEFTGFIQWDRTASVGSDTLRGGTPGAPVAVRLDSVRSIVRLPLGGARATLHGADEIAPADGVDVEEAGRGVAVEDPRYGRVLISWDAFERVDFSAGGSGPAYDDVPAGRPLSGNVTTRAGDRFAGRVVFDLDEATTVETLDAPSAGVNFSIPFGLIATIAPPGLEMNGDGRARVVLHDGEELRLEPAGDLGERNAGMLIFVEGRSRPEYVPWADVLRIDLDRP